MHKNYTMGSYQTVTVWILGGSGTRSRRLCLIGVSEQVWLAGDWMDDLVTSSGQGVEPRPAPLMIGSVPARASCTLLSSPAPFGTHCHLLIGEHQRGGAGQGAWSQRSFDFFFIVVVLWIDSREESCP